MRSVWCLLRTALLCGVFSSPSLADNSQTLQQLKLQIPLGDSFWTVPIKPERTLDGLQLRVATAGPCSKLGYWVDFRDADSGQWRSASFKNAIYETAPYRINELRVGLRQNISPVLLCDVALIGNLTQTDSSIQGRSTLVGVINYQGGFVHEQAIDFAKAYQLKQVQVKVPSFCQGAEILEVKAPKEALAATRLNTDSSIWNLPTAKAIDSLSFSLNGPSGLNCQIPVYVYDLAS